MNTQKRKPVERIKSAGHDMNAKRTPGPWRVLDSDKLQVVRDIAGHTAAVAIASRRSVVMRDEAEANAQFIVTAANCHDELTALLEAAADQQDADGYIGVQLMTEIRAALARARQA